MSCQSTVAVLQQLDLSLASELAIIPGQLAKHPHLADLSRTCHTEGGVHQYCMEH